MPLVVPTAHINRLANLNAILPSTARHRDCRSRVGRQLHFEMETVPVRRDLILVRLKVPSYADFAVRTDVFRIGVSDVTAWDGSDKSALPARLGGREAADVGMDPVGDGAEGVVVCEIRLVLARVCVW